MKIIRVILDRDSSVGMTIRYKPDGLEIEFRQKRGFSQPSILSLDPSHPPLKCASFLFPGGKEAETWH